MHKFKAIPLLLAGLVRFMSHINLGYHIGKIPFATKARRA